MVAAAFFLRRSYDTMASKLGIGSFRTTGLLYLIGAGLVILVGLGFIVIFVAEIFQAISFFAIPEQPVQTTPGAYTPPPSGSVPITPASNQPMRFCANCGAAVDTTAKFCRNCGKTLE